MSQLIDLDTPTLPPMKVQIYYFYWPVGHPLFGHAIEFTDETNTISCWAARDLINKVFIGLQEISSQKRDELRARTPVTTSITVRATFNEVSMIINSKLFPKFIKL